MSLKVSDPSILVIFGGSGDLSRRKLLPALGRLAAEGSMHEKCHVIGVATSKERSQEDFIDMARQTMSEAELTPVQIDALCDLRLHYQGIGKGTPEDFAELAACIESISKRFRIPPRRTFYLALPTGALAKTVEGLRAAGLNQDPEGGWTRIVVEKPFGTDLASAEKLVALLRKSFKERQIYRIDHYLGKEAVQNLLAFRFGNTVFESIWNRDRIESVEITVSEELGVGTRAAYYDKSGAMRDMIQNHLIQLLSLVAMEPPLSMEASAVRQEKAKVLRAIAPILNRDVAYGQYGPGEIDHQQVKGYLEEHGIPANSSTETFAAVRLEIMNWRWQGVPFYLRTGKRMPKRLTRIGVRFKNSPICMFERDGICDVRPNVLIMTLQPDEGFSLHLDVKTPGESGLQRIPLGFKYSQLFGKLTDAYQTLLLDVLSGDQALFVHSDEVLASWKLFDPLLQRTHSIHTYEAGSWGPSQAQGLAIPESKLMRQSS